MRNTYHPQTVPHPKCFLEESLEEREMGAKEFAIRTGKPEKTITAILKGESSITADMAIQFEKVLQIPAHFWMKSQSLYDENQARNKFQQIVKASYEWAKSFPYAEMAKLNWVKPTRNMDEKVIELFNYFGVATPTAWQTYYFDTKLRLSFRASLKNTEHAHALTAWLRHGHIQAQKIDAPPYSKATFKKKLEEIKELVCLQPNNFFRELQRLCLEAGVIVVYSPCLPKVPIHGATRWNNNTPIIQLTGRYKQNDIFWFTFFHEAGHIFLHGKKYISLENISYDGINKEYEQEANNFAEFYLFNKEQEAAFLKLDSLEEKEIESFAKKHHIHPAIIVGRLQSKKIISYSEKRSFFVPIVLE